MRGSEREIVRHKQNIKTKQEKNSSQGSLLSIEMNFFLYREFHSEYFFQKKNKVFFKRKKS